jgi:hypothetical protein
VATTQSTTTPWKIRFSRNGAMYIQSVLATEDRLS